jgi:predicted metal-dependent hydrolase
MHGRWFGGRQLAASLYDGRTDYNAHKPRARKESEAEEAERLERFARELEEGSE